MEIVLIHYRILHKGGLETRLYNYAAELRRRGHGLRILCAKIAPDAAPLPPGVSVTRLSPGLAPKPFRRLAFARKVRRYLDQHPADWSLSLGRTTGQAAVLAPANHRGFLRALGRRPRTISDWLQDYLDQRAFATSDHIFAASRMMRDELIDLYDVPPARLSILPPPVDTTRFHPGLRRDQPALRARLGLSAERRAFLFVSTSHYRKGLDRLLAVFAALPEVDLYVAGDRLPARTPPNVHHLGFQDAELPQWYAAVDATLHPARYEPFGQVITESLQCGTPVLVSEQTGAAEVLTPACGRVIPGADQAAWIAAVRDFRPGDWEVPPNFAAQAGLTLVQHVDALLAVAAKAARAR